MRLIDADVLRERFQAILDRGDMFCEYDIVGMVDNAPTVDAYTEDDVKNAIKEGHEVGYEMAKAKFERPQGEWIEYFDSSSGFTWRTCSRCMFEDGKKYYKFCPNCGAYMRGGRE